MQLARILLISPLAEEPLQASNLFHNCFDTDLSVVTTTKLFYKMLRVFGCDAIHSVARDTTLTTRRGINSCVTVFQSLVIFSDFLDVTVTTVTVTAVSL